MSYCRFTIVATVLMLWALAGLAEPIPVADLRHDAPVDFEKEVLPFLRTSCLACHSRTTAKGGLNLETPQTILKGSEDGPVVVPGKSDKSPLLESASHR